MRFYPLANSNHPSLSSSTSRGIVTLLQEISNTWAIRLLLYTAARHRNSEKLPLHPFEMEVRTCLSPLTSREEVSMYLTSVLSSTSIWLPILRVTPIVSVVLVVRGRAVWRSRSLE